MKHKFALLFASAFVTSFASAAEGLYNVGTEAQNSVPIKWSVGASFTYDDNVNPGATKDSAVSLNPFVGSSFISITPQTTWDVYGRLGCVYYIDKPSSQVDDIYAQARTTVNLTHRFDERLRLSSRNAVSYELEPDYSYGVATSRVSGAYLFWATDNSLGYRWSERVATYTGISLTGLDYGGTKYQDQNRFTWEAYNQFRYQLTPERCVLTFDYRYRFSPTAILVTRAGLQLRQVNSGSNSGDPYAEMALDSRLSQDFTLRGFLRYSIESYDTVQQIGSGAYDFNKRQTLRVGLSADYKISSMLSVFSGLDYIPAQFDKGVLVGGTGPTSAGGLSQHLFNASVGFSVKLIERFYGTVSYNYTESVSDIKYASYDRNRISIGLNYQF